ncbi:MAG: hypothetical protein ACYC5O_10345, partial [Anaerolineae bacterium]
VTLVVVTPAGADRLADVMTKARAFMETCLIGIDAEDIATVVRVLGRMRENVAGLGETDEPDCPMHHFD